MSETSPAKASKIVKKRKRSKKKSKKDVENPTNYVPGLPPKLKSLQKENISSNWKNLKQTITVKESKHSPSKAIPSFKRMNLTETKKKSTTNSKIVETQVKAEEEEIWFDDVDESLLETSTKETAKSDPEKLLVKERSFKGITKIIGMDCEMVGVGKDGSDSIVARVSLVNQFGNIIFDSFVAPTEEVTDFRTSVSGVRPHNVKDAPVLKEVQTKVAEIIKRRILVGHAIHHDLKVLFLSHPRKLLRDTSTYKPFRAQFGGKTPGLKKLIEHYIGVRVQTGEHSSVQDAQAAVRLYTMFRKDWEKSILDKRKRRFTDLKEKVKEEQTSTSTVS
eukprot:TRINITY_DN3195_c0_g1_i4.p1 TRINITY_DN3195_c0_g1~~TRINITY_DN3195_c0_g1_i4.p1  ORF type:complete len:333 (-),score=49.42 TRINITY_DN3195_c0_g1_i4:174-1172(-)